MKYCGCLLFCCPCLSSFCRYTFFLFENRGPTPSRMYLMNIFSSGPWLYGRGEKKVDGNPQVQWNAQLPKMRKETTNNFVWMSNYWNKWKSHTTKWACMLSLSLMDTKSTWTVKVKQESQQFDFFFFLPHFLCDSCQWNDQRCCRTGDINSHWFDQNHSSPVSIIPSLDPAVVKPSLKDVLFFLFFFCPFLFFSGGLIFEPVDLFSSRLKLIDM